MIEEIGLDGAVIFHTAVSPAGIGPTSSNKVEIEASMPELAMAGVRIHVRDAPGVGVEVDAEGGRCLSAARRNVLSRSSCLRRWLRHLFIVIAKDKRTEN